MRLASPGPDAGAGTGVLGPREDSASAPRAATTQDITVVVPTRNVEDWLHDCLTGISASEPFEVIVVDGLSTDATRDIARAHGARVLSDEGQGVAAARMLGAQAARTRFVAVVDADVVLTPGALGQLLAEFERGGYTGLQAGLHSVSDGGYWGEALAAHHRSSRSRWWFGVVATLFERKTLLEHSLDTSFLSGEDIDLRWRLRRSGAKIGVSRATVVQHRFGSGWAFAKGQWLADGQADARMMLGGGHGARAVLLLGLPLAAGVRGAGLSVLQGRPKWVPYYVCYCTFNYVGMGQQLLQSLVNRARAARSAGRRPRRRTTAPGS